MKSTKHWTYKISDFLFSITEDFVLDLRLLIERRRKFSLEDKKVFKKLDNHEGKMSLRQLVRAAKNYGLKSTLVVYDDNDPKEELRPLPCWIFRICWELCGKPVDGFDLRTLYFALPWNQIANPIPEEDGGGWDAFINFENTDKPENIFCRATGDTKEEALACLDNALRDQIDRYYELGKEIPIPRKR